MIVEAARLSPRLFRAYFSLFPSGKNSLKADLNIGFCLFTRIKVSKNGGGFLNFGSLNLRYVGAPSHLSNAVSGIFNFAGTLGVGGEGNIWILILKYELLGLFCF